MDAKIAKGKSFLPSPPRLAMPGSPVRPPGGSKIPRSPTASTAASAQSCAAHITYHAHVLSDLLAFLHSPLLGANVPACMHYELAAAGPVLAGMQAKDERLHATMLAVS